MLFIVTRSLYPHPLSQYLVLLPLLLPLWPDSVVRLPNDPRKPGEQLPFTQPRTSEATYCQDDDEDFKIARQVGELHELLKGDRRVGQHVN